MSLGALDGEHGARTMEQNFDLTLLAGRTLEHAIKDAIKQRYSVVATGNVVMANGHGPRMENNGAGVVLADLQLYRGVRAGWVEVKSKSRCNVYRNWNRPEHGIDQHKLNHYRQLQADTGQTVYLLICEANTGDVLMQSIDTLMSVGNVRYGGGFANWDRQAFAVVGKMNIPVDDLRRLSVDLDWATFETFVTQPLLLE